jgi:hypothetical protein
MIVNTRKAGGIETGTTRVLRLTVIIITAIGVIEIETDTTGTGVETKTGKEKEKRIGSDMGEINRGTESGIEIEIVEIVIDLDQENGSGNGNGNETAAVNMGEIVKEAVRIDVVVGISTIAATAATEAKIGMANVIVWRSLGLYLSLPKIGRGALHLLLGPLLHLPPLQLLNRHRLLLSQLWLLFPLHLSHRHHKLLPK